MRTTESDGVAMTRRARFGSSRIRPQPIGDTLSRCFWRLPLSVLAGTNGRERATVLGRCENKSQEPVMDSDGEAGEYQFMLWHSPAATTSPTCKSSETSSEEV